MNYEKPDTGPAILDRVEAGHRQAAAEAAMAAEFVKAAHGCDLTELAPWAPRRTEYARATGNDFKRLATVGEVLTDSLDYSKGPTVEDLLRIVCAVSTGHPQQALARALIQRMAETYAKYNAEAEDE